MMIVFTNIVDYYYYYYYYYYDYDYELVDPAHPRKSYYYPGGTWHSSTAARETLMVD